VIRINQNYAKLQSSYLFSDIARRIEAFGKDSPEVKIIKLGIGDVTRALPPSSIGAFHAAVDEMAEDDTFRGYGPEQGYAFLREAIAKGDYASRGVEISPEEIFISDGAKCDTGNIQELFDTDITVAVTDPVYPVYVDTNVMAGRTGTFSDGRYHGLVYLESTRENGFVPSPPSRQVDLIYLCFPNNPTGAVATKEQLSEWISYAKEHHAILLFDAAYVEFIRNPDIPHSIFEIEGAREVAIEFRSFSKNAGFTGTRCAFTVIPHECTAWDKDGKPHSLHKLWNRRHTTKFNGVSYPVQRAAAAVYSEQGQKEIRKLSDFYLENAAVIREHMTGLGYLVSGGVHSPYVWVHTAGKDSWEFFEMLLREAGVVTTPGTGFGKCGQGYIRISAFNSRENVEEAMQRISAALSGT